MPKKSTPKNIVSSSFRNFIVKHSWSVVGIGLIVALIIAIIGFFAFVSHSQADEKRQFQEIKRDILTLQSRLNAQDDGQWKYTEGCDRSGGGFQPTITYCGLGLSREFKDLDQQEINVVVERTNKLFRTASLGLFISKKNFALATPHLNNMRYSETTNDYLIGDNDSVKSTRPRNNIVCGFTNDLSAAAPVTTGELTIDFGCSENTAYTYFNRIDVKPEFDDHKAESPL